MFEIFGIPSQALFGQLLIGLINGSSDVPSSRLIL